MRERHRHPGWSTGMSVSGVLSPSLLAGAVRAGPAASVLAFEVVDGSVAEWAHYDSVAEINNNHSAGVPTGTSVSWNRDLSVSRNRHDVRVGTHGHTLYAARTSLYRDPRTERRSASSAAAVAPTTVIPDSRRDVRPPPGVPSSPSPRLLPILLPIQSAACGDASGHEQDRETCSDLQERVRRHQPPRP